ncbi:MAG: hypothetical protein F9K40_08125 [Kofleriaceae bacterium]|nr:MAG: hypothetical protein F9K40_08125 [Kofleriaceae bacterium]MBZ0235349.1 hypothetical protein [Kofleriaceae bacterium]
MRRMRWLALVTCTAVVGACAPCDRTFQVDVYENATIDVALASYAGGPYVMWSVGPFLGDGEGDVFIRRLGGRTVRLSDRVARVTLGRTADGLLACREGYEDTRCEVLDWRLDVAQPEQVVDLQGIIEFVVFDDQLHALVATYPVGTSLVPIASDGTPTGGPWRRTCTSPMLPVVASNRIACFFYADSSGETAVELMDTEGRSRYVVVGEGGGSTGAARGDDILVAWRGCDRTCTRVLHGDGTMGPIHSLPDPVARVVATGNGYAALWPEDIGTTAYPRGPTYARLLDREGAPREEADLTGPSGYEYEVFGAVATDDGFAAVWSVDDPVERGPSSLHVYQRCDD